MSDQDKQQEIDRFLDEVKEFTEVTPIEADQLLEANEGNIVFIGRETCPFCRKFVRTLSPLAEEHDLKVNFVHSQHPDHEEEIKEFREKYDVPTVPGLLYSSASAGLIVKCDSSLTEDEILEIVEAE